MSLIGVGRKRKYKAEVGFTFGDDFLQYVKVGFMRQPYSTTSVHFEASLAVQTFSEELQV